MGTEAVGHEVNREWSSLFERVASWQVAREAVASTMGNPPPPNVVEVVARLHAVFRGLPAPVSQLRPEFVEMRWTKDPLVFAIEFQPRDGTAEDALFARLHPFWFFRNRRSGEMHGGSDLFDQSMTECLEKFRTEPKE